MQRKILTLRPSSPKAPKLGKYKRSRNEFKAWVTFELLRRGATFETATPSYTELRDAIEKYGLGGRR